MATPGKIVVTSSGKRGVRSTGKVAIFNSHGGCPECCGEGGCGFCDGETPDELEVIFSGVTGCCIPGIAFTRTAMSTVNTVATLNNPSGITLTRDGPDSCVWSLGIIHVGYISYPDLYVCTVPDFTSYTAWVDITLTKVSDTSWTLTAKFSTTLVPYSGYLFTDTITGQATNCTDGLAFTNDLTSCSGLAHGAAGYNGSASVSVP